MRRVLSIVPFGLALGLLAFARPVQAADTRPPVIDHTPVTTAVRGDNLPITAHITDESEIFGATLWYRQVGDKNYVSVELTHKGDLWGASIPVNGDLEYWMEAYDEFGNGPTRAGSSDKPFVIKAVARPPPVVAHSVPVAPAGSGVTPNVTLAPGATPSAGASEMDLGAGPSTSPSGVPTATAGGPPVVDTTKGADDDDDLGEADHFPTHVDKNKSAAVNPSALAPPVEKGPPVPYYQQWWFGTTIGVVGAAAIVTAVVLLIPKPVYRNVFNTSLNP